MGCCVRWGVGHACSNVNDLAVDMAMEQKQQAEVVSAFTCALPMQRTRTITRADMPRSRPRTGRRRTSKGPFVPPSVRGAILRLRHGGAEKRPFGARTELWAPPLRTSCPPCSPVLFTRLIPSPDNVLLTRPSCPHHTTGTGRSNKGSTRQASSTSDAPRLIIPHGGSPCAVLGHTSRWRQPPCATLRPWGSPLSSGGGRGPGHRLHGGRQECWQRKQHQQQQHHSACHQGGHRRHAG